MNRNPAGSLPGRLALAAGWFAFFCLTALLYTPYLGAPYFSDDFLFFFTPHPAHLYQYFWMPGAASHLYRPAEAILLTLIQTHYGFNTLAIHLISMAAQATLCCAVWYAAARLGFSRTATIIAVLLMFATQTAAPAMLGNDCMSQAVSSALGALAVLFAALAYLNEREKSGRSLTLLIAASVLAFFCGLFFKETGLGLAIAIALLAFLPAYQRGGWSAGTVSMIRRMIPYAILTGVYVALRMSSGRQLSGQGNYRIGLGFNVIKNLAQYALAILTPASSVTAAVASQERDYATLLLIGLGLLLVAGVAAIGIWRTPRGLAALLLTCIGCAMFPAVVLQHASELYVYNAAPYAALLLGYAFATLWARTGVWRIAAVICVVLLAGAQLIAVRQKGSLMNGNGERAQALLGPLVQYIHQAPAGGDIVLTKDLNPLPEYSVYLLNGVNVLEFGCENLGAIFGRPDVRVHIEPKASLSSIAPHEPRMILELRDGSLKPLTAAGRY